jgi:hypothetical protein
MLLYADLFVLFYSSEQMPFPVACFDDLHASSEASYMMADAIKN